MISCHAASARLRLSRHVFIGICLLFASWISAACSTPNPAVNVPLQAAPAQGTNYSFAGWLNAQPKHLDEKLIVLSFSGGGVRAATLATGVLQQLKDNKLDSKIALISSTSGGSVTAAVFAAQGYTGLDNLEQHFLGENNTAAILPGMLARLVLPGANRATAFSAFLDKRALGNAKTTYRDLMQRWPQAPFVILNATDMSTGTTFEFTQDNFSNLCSDLAQFRVSHAIAASASFPFALNPLPLRNQWNEKQCAQMTSGTDANTTLAHAETQKYLYPDMLERARYLHALRHTYDAPPSPDPERKIKNIHLLDGGLSDNLAARAVLRELSTNLKELQTRGVRKIMVVQVNAKAATTNTYDNEEGIPSMVDVFWSVTTNPIDVVTELSAYVSRMYLVEMVRASERQPDLANKIAVYPVYVDFNLIDNPTYRARAQKIDTSWTLKHRTGGIDSNDVPFLERLGKSLMVGHPCFQLSTTAPLARRHASSCSWWPVGICQLLRVFHHLLSRRQHPSSSHRHRFRPAKKCHSVQRHFLPVEKRTCSQPAGQRLTNC